MFELEKWYSDCVSPQGDALIWYKARLRWGVFRANYDSHLRLSGGHVEQRDTGGPEVDFELMDDAVSQRIFESEKASSIGIRVAPRAHVVSSSTAGLGYREHLRMTIPPWKLPIGELRWGRYLSDHHLAVWIDWTGDAARTFAFHDSTRAGDTRIADDTVTLDDIRISFDRGVILRDGPIGSTVLAAVPGLLKLAPARVLALQETKWRSGAIYQAPGEPEERAWAIHEVVRWP